MIKSWQELTRMTGGADILIEKIKIPEKEISIEGNFELPPLARLSLEDQVFVTAFIRNHGSIKQTEESFGVSYPTIKNRLTRIAEQLEFVQVDPAPSRTEILDLLEQGGISVEEALKRMS